MNTTHRISESTVDCSAPRRVRDADVQVQAEARHRMRRLFKRASTFTVLVGFVVVCGFRGHSIVSVVLGIYVVCGVYDVLRNTRCDLHTIDRYFCGNGVGTWLLSPFNLLMDVLALPNRNRGVYELGDLSRPVRNEIMDLIRSAHDANLIDRLNGRIGDGRSMMFFKWYGRNINSSIDVPAFHRRYRFIRTIGVSVFNRRQSTSWHFGPLRATLRVLYKLGPTAEETAFIQVGDHTHRWNQDPLFIFDDTLMHRSCNESDSVRYCLFVDVIRPGFCPPLMRVIVAGLQCVALPIRFAFYSRWAEIR